MNSSQHLAMKKFQAMYGQTQDGVDGEPGPTGPTGPIGPVGPAGRAVHTGATGPAGSFTGSFVVGSDITIRGSVVHDFGLPDGSCFTLKGVGATITGFAGGRDGRLLILLNKTGSAVTLAQDTGSVESNRLVLPAPSVTVTCSATLIYAGGKWNLLTNN
jgi:hypothetical protein